MSTQGNFMNFSYLIYEERDEVGILTLNRPDALNALNNEVFDELQSFLVLFKQSINVRVLIITGAGRAFVAGADIKELQNMSVQDAYDFAEKGKSVFRNIALLPIPVIAAINGYALGGGLELALSCDIRVANKDTKLGMSEVSLGLIPGFNGTVEALKQVGLGHAMYLMMTADSVKATEAYELGLVQKLAEADQVLDDAIDMAKKIAKNSPNALRILKTVLREGKEMTRTDAEEMESREFGNLFDEKQTERIEGVNAFIEKRKPNWK
ncbi:enoyl-CoA hydratase/isomerase family protein [Ancylomarina sp. 16SWW S1-10-2]|uniref:enoyl-CoA hydratase/isomerase family protein n=1 Tax=Ancylomarina sp. 16SWW S1-10-2 TaxID=2499681 RepID=UPI0012ADC8EA|nr:enoyl-CoA hydratase/isomerase family protein [Ancylomarina sp. 16SWW S1-10-2]MRT94134.1 enoyl-CoA hydratase/isomerase family protein [Ancylomarina sp. 16SWW S1-10-2]